MNHSSKQRRVFLIQVACGASAAAAGTAFAADPPPISDEKLTETDAYAKSMGFRLDTTKVDKEKYKRHTVDQKCSECQLYTPKAGTDVGHCSFFGGRVVNQGGWCRNFKVRKAA